MAHDYVGLLLSSGVDSTGSTADLTLKNSNGSIIETKNNLDTNPQTLPNPSTGDPRIRFALFNNNVFQHNGSDSWSEPLELETAIDDGTVASAVDFESFFFDAPQGPLSDGDKLTIGGFALTYPNHPGVVAIVSSGGIGSTDFRFRLKDGGTVLATKTNPVSYSGGQNAISIDSNLEFTNNSGSQWSVDGLSCEAKDSGGTYREIDDVSFSNVGVGVNATIRFTSVTHNFNYP
jgi:hypothetical protein